MFELCLTNNVMPFVVLDDEKADYFRGLAEYADEPELLRDTFRYFQDVYYARFETFIPRG
ncbi:hypothetical protein MAE01_03580 [Microbacterium aerolatum]|uniref:Uncharacterized protein n=1 Tax=Microbacterium aerolatum TaxID=153731 RepID=A0A511AAR3_9MICO|nr:hypothetical protein MAE01_03580 [Microbacterium aerolatum]